MGLDEAFIGLLQWINASTAAVLFTPLVILTRRGYGWSECVEHTLCRDEADAAEYFIRCGALLCVLYVLQGTDFHYENVIASRNGPHLVDLETLLSPSVAAIDESVSDAHVQARRAAENTVLRCGFLPSWTVTPSGVRIDTSGMTAGPGPRRITDGVSWHCVNTDSMSMCAYAPRTLAQLPTGLALADGETCDSTDHVDDIISGFRTTYELLARRKRELTGRDGPLLAFRGRLVRVILRHTSFYGRLLEESLIAVCCRDGIARSLCLDRLTRVFLRHHARPEAWTTVRSEIEALEVADIPYFFGRTDGSDIRTDNGCVHKGVILESGWDRMCQTVARLCEADCERQTEYVRASFALRKLRDDHLVTATERHEVSAGEEASRYRRIMEYAISIGDTLLEQAIRGRDGSASWLGIDYDVSTHLWRLQALTPSLYSGHAGVSLFLAALGSLTQQDRFTEMAIAGVHSLLVSPGQGRGLRQESMPIGGFAGLGGIAYALLRIADMSREERLYGDALAWASAISEDRLARDEDCGVISGAAGAILACLALYGHTADGNLLRIAEACARHLLERAIDANMNVALPTVDGPRRLCGMSHGASGMAWALMQLWRVTTREHYRNAAIRLLDYERRQFDREANAWPDLREHNDGVRHNVFLPGWCHGAAGIGLARLGIMDIEEVPSVREDATYALESVARAACGSRQLCCGEMGVLDFLLEASVSLGNKEALWLGYGKLDRLLGEAQSRGGIQLRPELPAGANVPGLMQGISGIGYELLRCVDGQRRLPRILLLA